MDLAGWIHELRRRRVIRALLGWGLFAFAVLQVVEPVQHALGLGDWTLKAVVAFLALGFPVTAGLSWVFDLTSRGVERTAAEWEAGASAPRPGRGPAIALVLVGALVGAGVAVLSARQLWGRTPAPGPDGRLTVAVADFANQTGEKELDALSGLLITALQQGSGLHVLTRTRMVDLAGEAGHAATERIDERVGREVGRRSGARALLLAAAHRLGGRYTVELRAIDPARDEYLFSLQEQAESQADLFALIDRLGQAVRSRLAGAAPASAFRVGEMTSSLEAWSHYAEGLQQNDRLRFEEAQAEFREALRLDPGFALAHAALAGEGRLPIAREEQEAHLRAALGGSDRLPERERIRLRGEEALFRGALDEAQARYQEVVAAAPDDRRAELRLAQLHFAGRNDPAAAWPHAERAVALAPGWFPALDLVSFLLIETGRLDEAATRAEAWLARWPSAELLAQVNHVAIRRGDRERALSSARQAVALGGGVDRHALLARTLLLMGDYRGAEASMRHAWEQGARLPLGGPGFVTYLRARGKRAEARRALDELDRMGRSVSAAPHRLLMALEDGDEAEISRALAASRNAPGVYVARVLLLFGRTAEAGPLLAPPAVEAAAYSGFWPWHPLRQVLAAEAQAGLGDWPGARGALEAVVKDGTNSARNFARLSLSRACYRAGDNACTVWALSDVDRWLPVGAALGLPDTLLHLAVAHHGLGHQEEARQYLGDLERLLEEADRGHPMVAEAKRLRARLGAEAPKEKRP